jgi:hypothetical protein
MWGNKEGWLISLVIVSLMGWKMWDLSQVAAIAAPSGQFKNLREPIALPIKPEDAVPGLMTEERDAGDLYWKAIEVYRADPKPYEDFEVTKPETFKELQAVNLVLQGATANHATIFIDRPEVLVNYKYPWPDLDAIFNVGQVTNSIGHYYVVSAKNANEELARRYLHAGFSLGTKLYNERLTHGELMAGIKLMQGAGDSLKELAKRKGDTARQAALQAFGDQTSGYYTSRVQTLIEKLLSAGQKDLSTHSGDVFELALHNPDRMWRTEALLKLGRYKYEKGGSYADQIWANRLLKEPQRLDQPDLTKDKDPAVARAATIARDLTVDEFHLIN